MDIENKAKEILEYCLNYLSNKDNLEIKEFEKTKLYKEMLKEITFLIDTD